MTLNPDVQARAHQELSSILHPLRLPLINDRPNLPYISAIVQEIWRWNPSVPLALPHMASMDDMYNGMKIEKGSTVWANVWGILHDESIFPDPLEFRPERYLGDSLAAKRARECVKVAFGLGRRYALPCVNKRTCKSAYSPVKDLPWNVSSREHGIRNCGHSASSVLVRNSQRRADCCAIQWIYQVGSTRTLLAVTDQHLIVILSNSSARSSLGLRR